MKPQISFQTAFTKASVHTFGNRRRGVKARAGGIILACAGNPPLYCPTDSVTRAQMAAFLARAFNL
jgi:hypothetical protein